MKKCHHCNIDIVTNRVTCPLCYTILEADNIKKEEKSFVNYPEHKIKKKISIYEKIFILISIMGIIVSILGNWLTYNHGFHMYWAPISIFAISYMWILIYYCILGKGFIPHRIFYHAIMSIILVVFVETFAQPAHDFSEWWSMNYVIPGILIFSMLAILSLTFVFKEYFIDSILGLFILAVLGVIPYILHIKTNLFQLEWTSLACCFVSIGIICTMLVFHFKECITELYKRFHI